MNYSRELVKGESIVVNVSNHAFTEVKQGLSNGKEIPNNV